MKTEIKVALIGLVGAVFGGTGTAYFLTSSQAEVQTKANECFESLVTKSEQLSMCTVAYEKAWNDLYVLDVTKVSESTLRGKDHYGHAREIRLRGYTECRDICEWTNWCVGWTYAPSRDDSGFPHCYLDTENTLQEPPQAANASWWTGKMRTEHRRPAEPVPLGAVGVEAATD